MRHTTHSSELKPIGRAFAILRIRTRLTWTAISIYIIIEPTFLIAQSTSNITFLIKFRASS